MREPRHYKEKNKRKTDVGFYSLEDLIRFLEWNLEDWKKLRNHMPDFGKFREDRKAYARRLFSVFKKRYGCNAVLMLSEPPAINKMQGHHYFRPDPDHELRPGGAHSAYPGCQNAAGVH